MMLRFLRRMAATVPEAVDELDLRNHEDPTICVFHPPPPPQKEEPMESLRRLFVANGIFRMAFPVHQHQHGRLPSIEEDLDEDLDLEVNAKNP